ncbi:MAG: hypothetical protein JSV62_10315 [Promethearchaeota archaeon]|nr:MAG: hypothetical protein JSV62_10315 [Candidatus Lokiarchaeota archaeon]
MTELFKLIEVKCPNCGKLKNINIPEAVFSQKKFGTIKIQIPINAVCSEHQFIAFVDTKGIIRGYERIDIQMTALSPEAEREALGRLNLRNLIKVFGLYGIFSLIHAKIFNYPSYVIKDDNFEYTENLLNSVGDNILPETYQGSKSIHILEEPNVNKIKVKDKDALIMDVSQNIYQTPWETKLKFEEEIVRKALDIIDEQEQLKLLQQHISKFISEVHYAISILQDFNQIYDDELIDKISKALSIKKISTYRLNLIKKFISRNVSKEIVKKIKNRVGEFLSLV